MEDAIPRSKTNDYAKEIIEERQRFLEEKSGVKLEHLNKYSFDPAILPGNIENFIGAAQVPIGLAGPLLVNGEHAQGEFYVPLATSEGTLVASYNRGMKIIKLCGGVTTTIQEEAMQRAPVFIFENARDARDFGLWLKENFDCIREQAESTTSVGKLITIEQYHAGRFVYTRFDYTTGDAAGQNMVTKATRHACMWMLDQGLEGLEHFALAANLDTDKKHSALNSLHTRGKRVVAEVTMPPKLIEEVMHTSGKNLYRARQLSNMGSLLAGSISNGAHYANGITAMFIACGQDVANVAESSAGYSYAELKDDGSYYFSVTVPSLIVATYGGGTGLPTQRECLETLGCYGAGKVYRFAEIVAATVLCGELSLGAAIVSDQWVSAHESFGRNRP